jgi:ABC-type bacteriocin/lantibiotic exporter with double-glycine peptidase domain
MILRKIFKILNHLDAKSISPIIVLIILNGFFEVIGISALIPIITLLISNADSSVIEIYKSIFNVSSEIDVLNYAITSFLLIYTVKSLFSLFVYYKQGRYIHDIEEKLTYKLFENEIYHLNDEANGVAEQTQIIISESNQFSRGVLRSLLSFLSELLISLSLLTYLLYQDPKSTLLIVLVIFVFTVIYMSYVGGKLTLLGKERIVHETSRLTLVKEFLQNKFKYKIEGLPATYKELLVERLSSLKKNYVVTALFNSIPKIYFEYVFILSICIIILFVVNVDGNYKDVIVSIMMIMAVFMKVVPSVNRMITSQQNFKYAAKVTDLVLKNIMQKVSIQQSALLLRDFSNINIAFDGNEIIKDSQFVLEKYKVIGVIGESGSGKSTLLRYILGLYGNEKDSPPYNNVSILDQDSSLVSISIRDNVDPTYTSDTETICDLMVSIGLSKLLENIEYNLDATVGEGGIYLSGGQKQRLLIIKTILSSPEYIILDESTSALDNLTQSFVIKLLAEHCSQSKIILITHRVEMLGLCDVVYQLQGKKIIKQSDVC